MTTAAQRDAHMDVESLRKSVRRPLDAFLFVSVIFLFLAVAAVVAFLAAVLKQPQVAALHSYRGDPCQAPYKMQNFVYLEATSSKLENVTMSWDVVEHGNGTSKGSLFDFDPDHYSLQPKQAGAYFVYVSLNLTCTHRGHCRPGRLTVQVGDKLTCDVHLRAEAAHETKKCWTVSHVDRQKLLAQMTVPKSGLDNWKLELKGSGLGMFLVD